MMRRRRSACVARRRGMFHVKHSGYAQWSARADRPPCTKIPAPAGNVSRETFCGGRPAGWAIARDTWPAPAKPGTADAKCPRASGALPSRQEAPDPDLARCW